MILVTSERARYPAREHRAMTRFTHIALGGLGIHVSSRQSIELVDYRMDDYMAFRRNGAMPAVGDISLEIVTNPVASNMGMRTIFESDLSWSVMSDGGRKRLITLQPPSMSQPVWSMVLDRGSDAVTVHCGPSMISHAGAGIRVVNPVAYPLDLILMMYALASRDGVIIHAAGIELDGRGILFPGISGAGKSTLTRLFAGRARTGRLSDDRIIVRNIGGELRMFGTPWLGEAGVCSTADAPLTAICFLRKDCTCAARRLDNREAIEKFLPLASVPWYDPDLVSPLITTCETITSRVQAYDFGFTPTSEAVDLAERIAGAQ